jgi:hypothetical protein
MAFEAEGGVGALLGVHAAGAAPLMGAAAAAVPGLALASPKLAGYGAYGVGALDVQPPTPSTAWVRWARCRGGRSGRRRASSAIPTRHRA